MAFKNLCAAGLAALVAYGALPAAGQDALLTARNGPIRLEGTMVGYDGEFYRLSTDDGTVTVDAQLVDCDGPGCPDLMNYVAEIRVSGARAMGEVLLPALVEAYAMHRNWKTRRVIRNDDAFRYDLTDPTADTVVASLAFHLSTTAEGFADLVAGESDVAMAVRAPWPDEIERGRDAGLGNLDGPGRARIVALDGLVPVVSPLNGLPRISPEDLARIWRGEVTDWAELGQPAAPMRLAELTSDGGFVLGLEGRVTALIDLDQDARIARYETAAELADALVQDATALGLTRFSEMGSAIPIPLSGACGRDLAASRRSLKAEEYPLSVPLLLYTPELRQPRVWREFVHWLTSPQAELVVRRAGFVDQIAEPVPLADQGDRLANAILAAGNEISLGDLQDMLREIASAERVTTTFRFLEGSTQLAPQSEGNVTRLANDIENGVFDGQEILLAGFSDGRGAAETNRLIAEERSETVAAAIRAAAPLADWSRLGLSITGFGEAMPLACDDSDWGRRTNRRVEVWLRPMKRTDQR